LYEYEEKGGTAVSARELGVDQHTVIKTLVMELEKIYINGGKRGYLVGISPQALRAILKITVVEVGIDG
jgi:prolyl-tRNA editing enzyme YbaK/EbsC (Cys-tRNA(Pro) deacylase)